MDTADAVDSIDGCGKVLSNVADVDFFSIGTEERSSVATAGLVSDLFFVSNSSKTIYIDGTLSGNL